MGVRTVLTAPLAGYFVPFFGQDWVWRLDNGVTFLMLPAFYWFFALSFPRQVHFRIGTFVSAVCVLTAGFTIAAGSAVGEAALKGFEVLALLVMAYLLVSVVRALVARETGSWLALVGGLLSVTATTHDILIDNLLITGINLIPLALWDSFCVCQEHWHRGFKSHIAVLRMRRRRYCASTSISNLRCMSEPKNFVRR